MKNFTFLALQGSDGTVAELAPIADRTRDVGGRLNVMHLGAVPILSAAMTAHPYGIPALPEDWVTKRNAMAEKLLAQQAATREFLRDQGLGGEVGTLCVEPAAFHDLVALHGLFADISIVADSVRKDEISFDNVVYGLLFEAPGPVILNSAKNPKALAPENVMLGWDNSLPAARAVRAALPILKAAKDVTIACIDPDASRFADGENPGADLATWLSHHGCHVTVQEYSSGHHRVGETLLARAKEHGADLVVMGAYGHRRWNERFFGGTTETMIKQTDVPVLLTH